MTQREIDEAVAAYDALLRTVQHHVAHLQGILRVCDEVGADKARAFVRVDEMQRDLAQMLEALRLTEQARVMTLRLYR